MKNLYTRLLLLMAAAVVLTLPSCDMANCIKGSGHVVSQTKKVEEFSKLNISSEFKVILKQDSSLTLNISADDNLIKYIKTSVHGGELFIKMKKNICNASPMTVIIGVHNLEKISTSGEIELTSQGKLNTHDFDLDLSGSSKVSLDINAANVTTETSGDTEIELHGQASSHHISMSGDGKLNALEFVVGDYIIETSGSSDCSVNVLHSLEVHSSGSSDIKYRGNPSNISNDKSGSSTLEKVE